MWPDQLHFLVLLALLSSQKLPRWMVLNAKSNPRKYQQRRITSDHSSRFFYPTYRIKAYLTRTYSFPTSKTRSGEKEQEKMMGTINNQ